MESLVKVKDKYNLQYGYVLMMKSKYTGILWFNGREQRQKRNALLKFLALSHKKNPRIFACENRRILTQKTESRAVSLMPPRKSIKPYD